MSKSNEVILDEFVELHFGKEFEYRRNQKEVILDILDFYDEKPNGLYLLDAPTGSGKSIIAMCVAGALTYKKKSGYILASDLELQGNYESDLQRFNMDWGSVKGVDNYMCDVNYEKHSLGDCRIKNMTITDIQKLPCYKTCGYFSNRTRAMNTRTSILNYAYWLIQRNYVAPLTEDEPFKKRDFIICDEAHKITEIVQNHFSPTINEKTRPNLEELIRFVRDEFRINIKVDTSKIREVIVKIYKTEDKEVIYSQLAEFVNYLSFFLEPAERVKTYIGSKYKGKEVPVNFKKGMWLLDWVKDIHCKFSDYYNIIKDAGTAALIKNQGESSIVFNCSDETYLMQQYFHAQGGFRLLMTATMGAADKFITSIDGPELGVDAKHTRIKSLFDYTKSPIYLYTSKRMSRRHREDTLPWVCKQVGKILDLHSGQGGIIHSGSYEIANLIYNELSSKHKDRVLIYSNSEEKKLALQDFTERSDAVIVGPSLLEGLDLKDNLSRFQVFAKVPFPSMSDKFVQAKMEISRDWYDWKSILSVLQGVGRSVRNENDWAITYFLDGCLGDLINRNRDSFPTEFLDRLRLVKG